jgi:hypothetical protein
MLLPIQPICDRRVRRDGTCPISIRYCISSERRTILYTGIALPPRYWNKKLRRISSDLPGSYGNASELNLQLQKMIRVAEDVVTFALQNKMENPAAFLKQVFQPDFDILTFTENVKDTQVGISREKPKATRS